MPNPRKYIVLRDFVYDFGVHGGAQGVIVLGRIAAGSVLLGSSLRIIDPVIAPTSDGAAVIDIGYGDEPSAFASAVAFDSGQFDAGQAHESVGAAAAPILANSNVTLTISGADLTNGKIAVRLAFIDSQA
jgi:hypothetical protein